jgi:hypothetical protein
MAKKNGVSTGLTLHGFEQGTLRLLLSNRDEVTAAAQAANNSVRNYVIQLLTGRGLDPAKWGISPDMTSFVEIQQPETPAPPPAPPAPGGPQAFAKSTPAAAPAVPRRRAAALPAAAPAPEAETDEVQA